MDTAILKRLYYAMLRIRMVEEKIAELYPDQEIRCPTHLCIGQEAIPVGVCAHLSKGDYIMTNHRSHGHYLAKGGNLRAMFAEIYGKAAGCSKGKGGSTHLVDLSVNMLGATPIVANTIPVAVGIAFGSAMKGEDRITAVFFGDAAAEEGVFCESLNFASLKKAPIIFICENNFYSVYSHISVRQPKGRDNLAIARAYGISGKKGDGNDIREVYKLTEKAASYVRRGLGPYYLEFSTYRFREHCGPNYDTELDYRPRAEFIKWRKRCPVEGLERHLTRRGRIAVSEIGEMRQAIKNEIEDAVMFAKTSPFPHIDEMTSDIYDARN